MTTFDDDMILVRNAEGKRKWLNCKANDIEWPPPERFAFGEAVLRRVSMSEITDEQRAGMTNVFRGAQYDFDED